MIPFSVRLIHDAGILQGKWLPFYVFHTRPSDNSKHAFYTSFRRHFIICKSLSPFQTCTAKTYKPSAAHEIWMISCWTLCTKASLWPVANMANTDLAVEFSLWEENETRLRQEWKWPQGRVAAHKLKDNHNVRADMPDKSNWLCGFKHIMTASTLDSQNKKRLPLSLVYISVKMYHNLQRSKLFFLKTLTHGWERKIK